jgi:hypothetical protein
VVTISRSAVADADEGLTDGVGVCGQTVDVAGEPGEGNTHVERS